MNKIVLSIFRRLRSFNHVVSMAVMAANVAPSVAAINLDDGHRTLALYQLR